MNVGFAKDDARYSASHTNRLTSCLKGIEMARCCGLDHQSLIKVMDKAGMVPIGFMKFSNGERTVDFGDISEHDLIQILDDGGLRVLGECNESKVEPTSKKRSCHMDHASMVIVLRKAGFRPTGFMLFSDGKKTLDLNGCCDAEMDRLAEEVAA